MSQLKISPTVIANTLSKSLNVDQSSIQLLSSVFSISGIFLALPGGAIMSKFGAKNLAIALMGCLALGNLVGYFFIDNYTILFLTRIIEGVSFAMFLTVAMVYISHWFGDKGSGTALGIFGTYSALGSMMILNIAIPIVNLTGYRSVWLLLVVLSLITMVLFVIFLDPIETTPDTNKGKTNFLKEALSNKKIWVVALAQGCMTFIIFTFIQVSPMMFKAVYELSDVQANWWASLLGTFGIPTGILAGILIDKTKRPIRVGMIGFVFMAIAMFVSTNLLLGGTLKAAMPFIFLLFLFVLSIGISNAYTANMIMASTMSRIPEITGYNVSIVNTIYYLIIVIGSPLTMKVVVSSGWNAGAMLLTSVSILGFILLLVLSRMSKKKIVKEVQ